MFRWICDKLLTTPRARHAAVCAVLLCGALLLLACRRNPAALAELEKQNDELPSGSVAIIHANQVARTQPDNKTDGILEGFLRDGRYAEGLAWLDTSLEGEDNDDRYRGLLHYGLGQADATLLHLLPIYRADPADDRVALAVAEASLWKKDYQTALGIVKLLQRPDAPDALRVRGMVFEQAGRLEEALALYERAAPQLAQPWETIERKALLLSWLKRFDAARLTYAEIANSEKASTPLRRRSRVRMAELTAWQENYDGALTQVDQLLGEDPKHVEALVLKGQILEWTGQFARAKRIYSVILNVDANHLEARARLDKLLWVE